mgnify:CR=1 FL=1
MVPEADLAAKTYAVTAKGTDLAGNKGQEASYNMKVTTRKDFKATILAGWNLMSFPSDPVTNTVTSVFSNAGIGQVVGYDAMAKGSPWSVATKDAATGIFSGALESQAQSVPMPPSEISYFFLPEQAKNGQHHRLKHTPEIVLAFVALVTSPDQLKDQSALLLH